MKTRKKFSFRLMSALNRKFCRFYALLNYFYTLAVSFALRDRDKWRDELSASIPFNSPSDYAGGGLIKSEMYC